MWPFHRHEWQDISRANVLLSVMEKYWSYTDYEGDTWRKEKRILDGLHITVLQQCKTCGDERTLNLRGSIPKEAEI